MTSGLRWPQSGILSRRGNRGRVTCKSSFVSSRGYYTNVAATHGPLWSWKGDTHTQTSVHTSGWRSTGPWQVKISYVRFPHDGPVNYWTELVLLIHALVCTQRISYLSNTPLHTHTWIQASSSFFCVLLQLEQMGLSAVRLSSSLVVLNSEASTRLSPSQIRRRISQARSPYRNA